MKPRRCPKCKQPPTSYEEIWSGRKVRFKAKKDGTPHAGGTDLEFGAPVRVEAVCKNSHHWTLSGVTAILDLC